MKGQITNEIKEKRSKKIIEISNKYEKEFLEAQIGKTLNVLFEAQEDEFCKGHTSNYILVKKEAKNLENKILPVKIIKIENLELIGK